MDLIDGFWFYEHQEHGIGEDFQTSVNADIDSLKIHAGMHPIVHKYHRMVCKTFPYNIYYRIANKTEVEVVAIIPHRQNRKPGQRGG